MVVLDQNSFFYSSKCYSLENDFNGMVTKFALENIFNEKYGYLELFILRINIIIAKEAIKAFKKTFRKNELWPRKILPPGKGKKIKKFKSSNKCNIKDWYKFAVLFYVTS